MTNRKLLLKFTEHFDGVQSCALSPDNTKVVSVDINSHTIVSLLSNIIICYG